MHKTAFSQVDHVALNVQIAPMSTIISMKLPHTSLHLFQNNVPPTSRVGAISEYTEQLFID
jgi:hypothetical protein